ncbi:LRR receptor-like serine/threonine-protein kinase GSO2 [Planoprotostelium fungivorum]|uniref:LRR receptor-like serine/threonine-protein kinase GSO2 n=1 Tax=Planoprotostelium fungivorum TaxID=1890364 RepID=A0A2P6NYD7_9EUKA|nr:LRR receptor-like serine/threonine-protein kinase GSO2 [Planoprotostelium fungivorum]
MKRLLFCFFLICYFMGGSDAAQDSQIVQTMKDMWKSLNGPNKYWAGPNICNATDYIGVTCDASNSYPEAIEVRGNGVFRLRGTIPPSVGTFINLTRFDLGGNRNLSGSIPDTICNLVNLNYLNLGTSVLTGSIPSCIGNLTLLQTIYLDRNRLNGTIPESMSRLTSLRIFFAYGNQLSGTIPQFFGQLQTLQRISLGDNQLIGGVPQGISNLPNLLDLVLGFNQLNGSLPARDGALSPLNSLVLNDNDFTFVGYINSSTCNLTNNLFPCYPPLDVPANCTFTYLPCTMDTEIARLYDTDTTVTSQEAQNILNLRASSNDTRTVELISALVPPLLRGGQSFRYHSVDVNVTIGTFLNITNNGSKIAIDITNSTISASIPSSILGVTRVSLAVSSLSFNPFSSMDNQSVYGQVVGVTVYDGQGEEIQIRDTTELMNISMGVITLPSIPSGYEAVCQWWNETKNGWSADRSRLIVENNHTVCQTNHLTNFSIGIAPIVVVQESTVAILPGPTEGDNNQKTLIIVIACCGAAGIALITIVAILIYRRSSSKSRDVFNAVECEVKRQLEWKEKVWEGRENQVWKVVEDGTTTVAVKKCTGKDVRSLVEEATRLKVEFLPLLDVEIEQELHHPNIVMCFRQDLSEKWIMMEWLPDGSISAYSQLRPVSHLVFSIGNEVAQAMSYVSEQKIVHTNLTPDHILLHVSRDTAVAKVTGFSGCVAEGSEYHIKGKEHTAPEVNQNHVQHTSADVWSFGVLLSFIASDGKSKGNEKRRTARGVRIDEEWDVGLKAMIQDCTVVDAHTRPAFHAIARRMKRDTRREAEISNITRVQDKQFLPYNLNWATGLHHDEETPKKTGKTADEVYNRLQWDRLLNKQETKIASSSPLVAILTVSPTA